MRPGSSCGLDWWAVPAQRVNSNPLTFTSIATHPGTSLRMISRSKPPAGTGAGEGQHRARSLFRAKDAPPAAAAPAAAAAAAAASSKLPRCSPNSSLPALCDLPLHQEPVHMHPCVAMGAVGGSDYDRDGTARLVSSEHAMRRLPTQHAIASHSSLMPMLHRRPPPRPTPPPHAGPSSPARPSTRPASSPTPCWAPAASRLTSWPATSPGSRGCRSSS